jgi:hypothetical protein
MRYSLYFILFRLFRAVSGRNDSAERANAALSWMKDRFNAGDINARLTAIHYTTCIGIWYVQESQTRVF